MKQILILLLSISVTSIWAQSGQQAKTVKFCFRQITVPTDCTLESEYQFKTEEGSLSWIYVEADNMIFASNGLIKKLETYTEFTKERISCYLLDHRVNGYRVSFKNGRQQCYQIIAFGIVNNQPVVVQLSLKKSPMGNADIPSFAQPFIRF